MRKKLLALIIVFLLTIAAFPVDACASGATKIDATTFRGNTKITQIHIGSDVTDISSSAFRGLCHLQSITVSEKNNFYSSYSNCLYNKSMTELICFPAALKSAYIPETVTSIGDYALNGVAEDLKEEIRAVVEAQAANNLMEWEVPGDHFIHTEYGVKWRAADGTIYEPDTEIKKLVASILEVSCDSSMTQVQQLEKSFNYVVNAIVYERKLDVPVGLWTENYAKEALLTGKANCYGYAAAFAYVAKGLGFEARVCTGTVQSALGGKTPHAWTEVKLGDKWYIFDTEMQDAKGSGYYKQTYDTYPAKPIDKQASITVFY